MATTTIIMKSTKVQNPRHIPRIKPIMRGYYTHSSDDASRRSRTPRSVLAATRANCIGIMAAPAFRPSKIIHDAPNGQAARDRPRNAQHRK